MQCKPPAQINSLDFQPNWGMYVVLFVSVFVCCVCVVTICFNVNRVAAGTCHGFAVGNFFLKTIVLTHCTIVEGI